MRRNIIERTGFRTEVLKLAAYGSSSDDIAEKLNEWDAGQSGVTFTSEQVEGFLERVLDGGRNKAMDIQSAKDKTELTALAKQQMEHFRIEVRLANSSPAPDALKRYKITSELLLAWFDRNMKLEGLDKPGSTTNNIQINQIHVEQEKDALLAAVKDYLAKDPGAWELILKDAKVRREKLLVVDAEFTEKSDGDPGQQLP